MTKINIILALLGCLGIIAFWAAVIIMSFGFTKTSLFFAIGVFIVLLIAERQANA